MHDFLLSLLGLALASFIGVFGIGLFVFRKDFIAAYRERQEARRQPHKSMLETVAFSSSKPLVIETSTQTKPARNVLSVQNANSSRSFLSTAPKIYMSSPSDAPDVGLISIGTLRRFVISNDSTFSMDAA
jgi:hypothetical protein